MKNHAFTYRTILCIGFVYAALGFIQIANASFSNARPPKGFATNNGQHTFQNNNTFQNGTARAYSSINIGGQEIQIPNNISISPEAKKSAARHLFRHPLAIPAAYAASILGPHLFEFANNQWNKIETVPAPVSTGFTYVIVHSHTFRGNSPNEVCQMSLAYQIQRMTQRVNSGLDSPGWVPNNATVITGSSGHLYCRLTAPLGTFDNPRISREANSQCPAGHFITETGCVPTQTRTLTQINEQTFVDAIQNSLSYDIIPQILPNNYPIPINNPQPVPGNRLVPLSNPVPVPNTTPQLYQQKLVRVQPAPTATNPFRVSLSPYTRTTTSQSGITEPISEDSITTDPATSDPTQQLNFCIENPGVLACAPVPEFDVPEYEIPKLTESIEFTPNTAFHSSGSCPAPITISIGGASVSPFDMSYMCDLVSTYLRPILIFLASLTSVMILAGGFRM